MTRSDLNKLRSFVDDVISIAYRYYNTSAQLEIHLAESGDTRVIASVERNTASIYITDSNNCILGTRIDDLCNRDLDEVVELLAVYENLKNN